MKFCPRCNTFKANADFSRKAAAPDGLQSYCRPCNSAFMRLPEQRERRRRRNLERKYGITPERYAELLTAQQGLCALCGEPEKRIHRGEFASNLAVDHDHETGEVRGLLCGGCNTALGLLGDTVEGLEKAMTYLQRGLVKL